MRILIAENQSIVRSALRLRLEQEPGITVVGEAANQEEAEAMLHTLQPDLVLLEWELSGDGVAGLIQRYHAGTRAVVLSSRPEVRQQALQAGADLFVSMGDAPESVLAAIRSFSSQKKGRN